MTNAISLQFYFILQENHEGMETDWTTSASTVSDNVYWRRTMGHISV